MFPDRTVFSLKDVFVVTNLAGDFPDGLQLGVRLLQGVSACSYDTVFEVLVIGLEYLHRRIVDDIALTKYEKKVYMQFLAILQRQFKREGTCCEWTTHWLLRVADETNFLSREMVTLQIFQFYNMSFDTNVKISQCATNAN